MKKDITVQKKFNRKDHQFEAYTKISATYVKNLCQLLA